MSNRKIKITGDNLETLKIFAENKHYDLDERNACKNTPYCNCIACYERRSDQSKSSKSKPSNEWDNFYSDSLLHEGNR